MEEAVVCWRGERVWMARTRFVEFQHFYAKRKNELCSQVPLLHFSRHLWQSNGLTTSSSFYASTIPLILIYNPATHIKRKGWKSGRKEDRRRKWRRRKTEKTEKTEMIHETVQLHCQTQHEKPGWFDIFQLSFPCFKIHTITYLYSLHR